MGFFEWLEKNPLLLAIFILAILSHLALIAAFLMGIT